MYQRIMCRKIACLLFLYLSDMQGNIFKTHCSFGNSVEEIKKAKAF